MNLGRVSSPFFESTIAVAFLLVFFSELPIKIIGRLTGKHRHLKVTYHNILGILKSHLLHVKQGGFSKQETFVYCMYNKTILYLVFKTPDTMT
jgi:hypothetical protein